MSYQVYTDFYQPAPSHLQFDERFLGYPQQVISDYYQRDCYQPQYYQPEYHQPAQGPPQFDERFFGYPHRVASPQTTETFWQQLPEESPQSYIYYDTDSGQIVYHSSFPVYNMDGSTTVIGKKFSSGGKATKGPSRPKPETVDVYASQVFVKAVPLRQLVRFSKVAANKFPRPKETGGKKDAAVLKTEDVASNAPKENVKDVPIQKVGGGSKKGRGPNGSGKPPGSGEKELGGEKKVEAAKSTTTQKDMKVVDWAEAVEVGLTLETKSVSNHISDDGAGVASSKGLESSLAVSRMTPANEESEIDAPLEKPGRKVLFLEVEGVIGSVTPQGVMQHLSWMDSNANVHNNNPLYPFVLPDPSKEVPLRSFVDVYAAALALDMRPFPVNLRTAIYDHLTKRPILRDDVAYIYEHLPLQDRVTTRMLTSIHEHCDALTHTQEQWDAIVEYVDTVKPLYQRYRQIGGSRKRAAYHQSQEERIAKAVERQKSGWDHFREKTTWTASTTKKQDGQGSGHGRKDSQTTNKTTTTANDSGIAMSTGSGTNGGKQGNGKGVGGKHVPGV